MALPLTSRGRYGWKEPQSHPVLEKLTWALGKAEGRKEGKLQAERAAPSGKAVPLCYWFPLLHNTAGSLVFGGGPSQFEDAADPKVRDGVHGE